MDENDISKLERKGIKEVSLSSEMKSSFLDYAMSVIVSRALPDVRDGLKPVHRRILYSMHDLGMTADKAYKKSARIVGDVIGKYHPHGDTAVYDSMVRMAQDFNYRYLLVDGHGNFGSVDGDSAAAMRYTEARMSKIAMEIVRDINKDTIDYQDNYDGSEQEPAVLPSRFPNLLVNGSTGIAVGMATNIPPHNLGEVIDGIIAFSKNADITITELMEYIPGPDFPTYGKIYGRSNIRRAYETGKCSITMRARYELEERKNGYFSIVIKEIPYQANKAVIVEKIANLVRDRVVEGVSDLRDESDRNGMRIVIELKKEANVEIILNKLYKQTSLQANFGINILALVDGQPKILNLKDCLFHYLEHQKVIVRRRTEYDLKKAEARAHILEGLRIALDNIDRIISLIRSSKTTEEAKTGLIDNFNLSDRQAQAILDMRLQRLTGLEREKIEGEYAGLLTFIGEMKAILNNGEKLLEIIRGELLEIKTRFNDKRRTEIINTGIDQLEDEDFISEENIVITLTSKGYIKRLPANTYRNQKRGGRGIQGMKTNEDDFVEQLVSTSTHDTILFFTNRGKSFKLRGFEIPEHKRTAKGIPIINKLKLEENEKVTAIIPVKQFNDEKYLFFTTKKGISKRSLLSSFSNIRQSGLIAVNLRDNDELISVKLTSGHNQIIIGTKNGQLIRFNETDIREMGRGAAGVRAIRLKDDDIVVGVDCIEENQEILIVTKNGYGKKTNEKEYRLQNRGGSGITTCKITDKNGSVVAVETVRENNDLMIITTEGVIIRMDVLGVSTFGRNSQGVKLIRLEERSNDFVANAVIVEKEELDLDEENINYDSDDKNEDE